MKNKEVLNRINKIKNLAVRDIFLDSYKKSTYEERQVIAKAIGDFEYAIKNDLNFKAKAIAAYVRLNIEDFHHNLTDAQMKELNQLTRNAIYSFLKDEADGDFMDISAVCKFNLAPYWEDCEYVDTH